MNNNNTFISLQSTTKVEKKFPGVSGGGGRNCHFWGRNSPPQEMSRWNTV